MWNASSVLLSTTVRVQVSDAREGNKIKKRGEGREGKERREWQERKKKKEGKGEIITCTGGMIP